MTGAKPVRTCYVAIDLETTGLDPERDSILEVAAVRFDAGGVLEEFHRLVQPEAAIPLTISRLTGLTLEDFRDAEPVAQVLRDLRSFVGRDHVVGQSIDFDLQFLANNGLRLEQPAIDTFELATILVPGAPRYGLGDLVAFLGLDAPAVHRALGDAHAHRILFGALVERARRLPPEVLATILRLGAGHDWPLLEVFELARRTPLALGAGRGAPARSTPPDALRPRTGPGSRRVPIDVDAVEGLIAAGGSLARRMERFEDRPGQREMLRRVAEAFNDGDQILIEAGTGTGKSQAYLLPAAAWAMSNGQPVVVATNTITLQDQLLESELPLARSLLGDDLRFCVLKGRANYLCRSRFEQLTKRDDLDLDAVRTVAKIAVWLPTTSTGDRAELMLRPEDGPTWRMVSAEGEACSRDRCRYAASQSCFVNQARARASASHVVVVNHALLASDVEARRSAVGAVAVLPDHRHLVIDEAHHLELAATDALGDEIGQRTIADAAGAIGGGGSGGLATRLRTLAGLIDDRGARADLLARIDPLSFGAAAVRAESTALFDAVGRCMGGDAAVRLSPAMRRGEAWLRVEMAWDRVRAELSALVDAAARVHRELVPVARANGAARDGAQTDAEMEPDAVSRTVAELSGAIHAARELVERVERVVSVPQADDIAWIARRHEGTLSLRRAPLHVGRALETHLFADKETLVLTSATLRAPDFDYVRERLSLPDADAVVVESPFDYTEQVLLCAPSDVPAPGRGDYDAAVARALVPLCTAVEGRTLALFTSHSGLRHVYHAIRGPLGEQGISVVAQGIDGSRHALLSTLRSPSGPTVVLGTRSFWEGVDVPGPALSCLVIARLPFDVPSDPIVAARSETFESPFEQYSVPQAILRFRQGFGRLIRRRTDRGVVVVLDSRIRGRRYGELFLGALPPCRRFDGSVDELPAVARTFLGTPAGEAGEMIDHALESRPEPDHDARMRSTR